MDRYRHLFPNEWDRLAAGLDQTHRAMLEEYQFGYQSDDEKVVSLEKARVTRANRGGAGGHEPPTRHPSGRMGWASADWPQGQRQNCLPVRV